MEMLPFFFEHCNLKNLSLLTVGASGRHKAWILMEFNILGFTKYCDLGVRMLSSQKCGLNQTAWVQIPDPLLTSSGNLGQVS